MSRAPRQGQLIGRGIVMNADDVRQQLKRILGSPGFDASARNRRFLEYIVEETLAGRADRLKGVEHRDRRVRT